MATDRPCVPDVPFVEWTAERTDVGGRPLRVLAAGPDGIYGAGPGSCGRLGPGGRWEPVGEPAPLLGAGVTALLPRRAAVWAGIGGGLAVLSAGGWRVTDDTFARGWGAVLALAAGSGDPASRLWVGTSAGVVAQRPLDSSGEDLVEIARLPGAIRDIAAGPEGLLLATDAGLYAMAPGASPVRHGDAPARALVRLGPGYLAATADGLAGVGVAPPDGVPPVRDLRRLAVDADGTLWAASPRGLLRRDAAGWHRHQGPRWLPSDDVLSVAAAGGEVHVATPAGLARLRPGSVTLQERADTLLRRLRARHLRLGAYVEETVDGRPVPSDNDGLWTGMYLAAECHRFAATGAPDARANADEAFAALEHLEAVTTIPGYPTKAIVEPGAGNPHDGPWYPSADGRWLWKGNCSSDEIVGHMYAYALYFDLVASAPGRARVAALVDRIMGHILENGLRILEFGQRTRWGYWYPEAVNGPECRWGDRGLNSLEILSHLRVAEHITGDPRYGEVYRDLVRAHGYAENTLLCKVDLEGHVNHSDDELAFLAYEPLLRYEPDGDIRSRYLGSLRRSWAFEVPERNPLWNFIAAAGGATAPGAGEDPPAWLGEAVRTLREIPTDTVAWPVNNAGRCDVALAPWPDRHGDAELTRVLPYDELAITRWNGNPYRASAGDARVEGDGVHFLLPYWMGRHHGWIAAPGDAPGETGGVSGGPA